MNTIEEQPLLHLFGMVGVFHIETQECTVTANVANRSSLLSDAVELNLEEGARVIDKVQEVLLLHVFPGEAEVNDFHNISSLFKADVFVL